MLLACPTYASDSDSGQAPVIFPGNGYYLYAPYVAINSVSGAVYYTTDGSNPANSKTAIAYSDSFPVSQSGVLLAAAHSSSGWSSVASAEFNISSPCPEQQSAAAFPVQASPFDLSALSNKEGQIVASVVYNGNPDKDTLYVIEISDAETSRPVGGNVITTDNTGVVIGPIAEGSTYQISIKQVGKTDQYYGIFFVQENDLDYDRLQLVQKLFYINENGVASELAVTAGPVKTITYSGYHRDGSLIFSGFKSPFKAIDAISTWEDGAYVLSSNGTTLFTKPSVATTYDMYRGTTYYGSTASLATANAWANNFACSHVIRGNGTFYENSYVSSSPPDDWALESQSGGYVYKYSYVSSTCETVYETLNFSQAKLRESLDSSRPYNAYVFIASQNHNGSDEGGIVCTASSHGNWYLYYKQTNTSLPTITSSIVCGSTLSGGVYRPNANLELVYSYTNGSFTISVKNLATNQVYSANVIADKGVGGSSSMISATSYVPITKYFNHTPDYQSGGYFKNVDYCQCYLEDNQGQTYDFWASSSHTHYLLEYNDDYCADTKAGAGEEIDIRY
jgi:hypothetical protein